MLSIARFNGETFAEDGVGSGRWLQLDYVLVWKRELETMANCDQSLKDTNSGLRKNNGKDLPLKKGVKAASSNK